MTPDASASGPFNFRGCDLTAEWLPAKEHVRVQFPATAPAFACSVSASEAAAPEKYEGGLNGYAFRATARRANILCRAPARAAESPKLSLPGAAPGRRANFMGAWQKSDASALQAESSGSVTRRPPPAFACSVTASEAAAPKHSKGGPNPHYLELRLGRPVFNCGKLDQCTERSLINFFRWV